MSLYSTKQSILFNNIASDVITIRTRSRYTSQLIVVIKLAALHSYLADAITVLKDSFPSFS